MMRAAGYPLRLVCQTLGVSRAGFYQDQRAPVARAPRAMPGQRGSGPADPHDPRPGGDLRLPPGVGLAAGYGEGHVNRKTVHRILPLKGWQCRLWHRPARQPKPT